MQKNRRMNSYAPPMGEKPVFSKLPVRLCLIGALVVFTGLLAFVWMTGSQVLYIHYWVYMAVAAVVILLLLGAAAFAICHRIRDDRARKYTGIGLGALISVMAMVVGLFCNTVSDTYYKPVVTSTSPGGESSIIVMKTVLEEGNMYTAYPLSGSFYLAGAPSEEVFSQMGVERVEWEGEYLVRVYMTDLEGKEACITVDYNKIFDLSGVDAAAGE